MPNLWLVHRAIAAILLAERGHPGRDRLVRAARLMIEAARPDEPVEQWLYARPDGDAI